MLGWQQGINKRHAKWSITKACVPFDIFRKDRDYGANLRERSKRQFISRNSARLIYQFNK